MVRNCVVAGCDLSSKTGHTTHSFPKDTKSRQAWIRFVKRTRADFIQPSLYSAICSAHFTDDCYDNQRIKLRESFGFPSNKCLLPESLPSIYPKRPSTPDIPNSSFLDVPKKKKRISGISTAVEKMERSRIIKDLLAEPIANVDETEPEIKPENDIISNYVLKDDTQIFYIAELLQPRPAMVTIDCQTAKPRRYRSAIVQVGPKTVVKGSQTNRKPPRQRSFGIQCDLLPVPMFPKLVKKPKPIIEQDTSDSDDLDEQVSDDSNDLPYEPSSSDSSSSDSSYSECSETSHDG